MLLLKLEQPDNVEKNIFLFFTEELLNNQDERLPYVKKMHADDTEYLNVKLQVNKDEQEDLKRQLQAKRDEENKLRETLYQHKCQYEKFENVRELCFLRFYNCLKDSYIAFHFITTRGL